MTALRLAQIGARAPTSTAAGARIGHELGTGIFGAGQVVDADAQPERGGDGSGGTPTLTLNDGGTATYTGGSGTNALTFSYTVAAGQNTARLAVTAVNLNGATVKDSGGNAANFSLTGLTADRPADRHHDAGNQRRLRRSPISGDLDAGKIVMLDAQHERSGDGQMAGGTPTLTLNDGGTATYSRRLRHATR